MRPFHLFTAFGIPVSVSPFYLLVLYIFGRGDLQAGMIWGACITAGLLVHEFGHALVARAFGLGPQVLLHGFGGVTSHQRAERRQDDALVVAAGPAAGLLFGLLTLGVVYLLGAVDPDTLDTKAGRVTVQALLFVNLGWSTLNLLPLWPLDGGQLLRLGLQKVLPSARTADRATHITGLVLVGGVLTWMYVAHYQSMYTTLILMLLGWQNYSALSGERSSGAVHRSHGAGDGQLREVRAALAAGNPREAARLCHVIRSGSNLSAEQLSEVWALLGVSTAALGEYEEALRYLRRAAPSAEVSAATRECLHALGREDELPALGAEQERRRVRNPGKRWLWVVVTFDLVTMVGVLVWWLGT